MCLKTDEGKKGGYSSDESMLQEQGKEVTTSPFTNATSLYGGKWGSDIFHLIKICLKI